MNNPFGQSKLTRYKIGTRVAIQYSPDKLWIVGTYIGHRLGGPAIRAANGTHTFEDAQIHRVERHTTTYKPHQRCPI